jgi:hypothetical protein
MKIGAENKKQVAIMAVLLAVALVVGLYNFRDVLWGSSASERPSLPASPAPQQKGAGTVAAGQDNDPSLRLDTLIASRAVKYEPGRNIFAMQQVQIPPVTNSVRSVRQTGELVDRPQPDPTPPPPPKIPLVFYGFANKPGEPKRVFLADGERNYVAGLNEIVDRRYKVVQIQATQVVIEDMLNNNQQPIRLTPRP